MASKKTPAEKPAFDTSHEELQAVDLSAHAEISYLDYAMSVVKGRAIPWIEDGLKPVQRRIIFAMSELRLGHTEKPKKSARVVGDVIGKYHPHGDASVYEAMVRTAQDFSLRYPLVDGQGNFGSRDGDGAAAMRYTEARMTQIVRTYLDELDSGTVDMVSTYDNTGKEPFVLPSRLPMILLNGGSGIGVGMASEVPSHNLGEVVDAAIHLIRHPKATLDELLQFIKGPDYATGALIISAKDDIRRAYAEGRGAFRARAKITVENPGLKNWRVVVEELPYPTNGEAIMEQIQKLRNPEPKVKNNKKVFSPEQLRLKALFGDLIDAFRDEAGKEHDVRLVIEPKSHKQDPQQLIEALLAYTDLEMNCPLNLVVVGRDRTPILKPLLPLLTEWCEFRVHTVERRCRFELQKASERLHILEGRQIILDHIEEVIRIIKSADDPKQALIDRFGLSEIQAQDVLEIRLRQLARMEHDKIVEEIEKLRAEIDRLNKLLGSPTLLRNQVIRELEADRKTFGDERRTQLVQTERVSRAALIEKTVAQANDEPVTVAVSERGWIRVRPGSLAADAFPFKGGDAVKSIHWAKTGDQAVFLDEAGKSYSTALRDLVGGKNADDTPIATLADFGGSKLAHTVVCGPADRFVLATSAGYGFICKGSDLFTRLRAGKSVVTLDEGAKLLPPCPVPADGDLGALAFAALASNRRLLVYRLSEIKELPRGKGVALLGLDDGQSLRGVRVLAEPRLELAHDGLKKPIVLEGDTLARHAQTRSASRKGKPIDAKPGEIDLAPETPATAPAADGGAETAA
jgi:topoisomerase IV subunit A